MEEESRIVEMGEEFDREVLDYIKVPLSSQQHEIMKARIREEAKKGCEEMRKRTDSFIDEFEEAMEEDVEKRCRGLDELREETKAKVLRARKIL